jgi:hypothetical protein
MTAALMKRTFRDMFMIDPSPNRWRNVETPPGGG